MVIWHIAQTYQLIVSQLGNCGVASVERWNILKAWYQTGQISFKALSIRHSLWRRANTENVSYICYLLTVFIFYSSTCMTPNVWHFPPCHHSFFKLWDITITVLDIATTQRYTVHVQWKNDITYTRATYSSMHSGLTSLTTS